MKIKLFLIAILMSITAVAQTTRTWEQTKYDEFEKGTSRGVAIRSDSVLELAPAFKPLATLPSTYIWAIASDKDGVLYAAAGAPSRVYRIAPSGEYTVVLAPPELQVQTLTVARDGTIYAATSPDGKVYRIRRNAAGKPAAAPPANTTPTAPSTVQAAKSAETPSNTRVELDPNYTSTVFFEPKTKYIWGLALDAKDRLYIATGDRGQIFRVDANGTGDVFFKSDEAHIRAITFDRDGNLIAGSDGSGLVYRISPAGEGFVLYSAPKKEITALAVDTQNNIYAAAAGDKREKVTPAVGVIPAAPANPATPVQPAANMPSAPMPVPGLGATGSEVYRIAADGSPRRLWSSHEDLVYALAFDRAGRLLAGTGNRGKVYAIAPDNRFTDLAKASANQLIGFAPAPDGGLYAATSNLGKIFLVQESVDREASFESDVYDAKIFSRFGRAEIRGRGNVDFFVRSGNVDNPDRNWSPWHKIDLAQNAPVDTPPARFVQWRAVLHSGQIPPEIDSVVLNYLPKNIAPEVDDVIVNVGSRYQATPRMTAELNSQAGGPARFDPIGTPATTRDHDYIAVRWSARDENDDQLTYSVYYRGDTETRWQLLKSGLADRFYSFESALLPDGGYTIRVVASDAPSHSPDDALTASRESTRFEVDNTPPIIDNLAARVDETGLHITFRAADSFSTVRRAEFSVDAGEWQFVAPVGGLSDARTENYDFSIPVPQRAAGAVPITERPAQTKGRKGKQQTPPPAQPGNIPVVAEEHVIVVRVYDRYDNLATAKVLLRPTAPPAQ
jgi:sugar lactone lactonase YvrE